MSQFQQRQTARVAIRALVRLVVRLKRFRLLQIVQAAIRVLVPLVVKQKRFLQRQIVRVVILDPVHHAPEQYPKVLRMMPVLLVIRLSHLHNVEELSMQAHPALHGIRRTHRPNVLKLKMGFT